MAMDSDLKEIFDEAYAVSVEGGATDSAAQANASKAVEDYKFRCEVREFIRIGIKEGRKALEARLGRFAASRGEDAVKPLRDAVYRQRSLGNDGEQGRWMRDTGVQQR